MIKSIKNRIEKNYKYEKKIKQDFPTNMLIELSNICNNKCVFCANRKMSREKGFINEDFLNRILKEAYDLGVREVGFYTTGEPFVSPKLDVYISKAKEIGFNYVYITTNGVLATPDKAKKVIEAGVDSVKFSINAGIKETYKLIHGQDSFDEVLNNLTYISNYRKDNEKNFKIYVSYIVTRQNSKEITLLKEKVTNLVDDIITMEVCNIGGMVYEINNYMSLTNCNPGMILPCPMLFNRFHITYEGYLNACCVDFQNYLAVSDLNKVSLKEAWNSEVFMQIRENHLNNNIKGTLCYNCINNTVDKCYPLVKELATEFNIEEISKNQSIVSIFQKL